MRKKLLQVCENGPSQAGEVKPQLQVQQASWVKP